MTATLHNLPFSQRLATAIVRVRTPALVGLDPRFKDLPNGLTQGISARDWVGMANAYRQFCCQIIDVVAPLVAVVKPQAAFFEQLGPAGMQALFDVIQHARQAGLLTILDGKRNDIGSTAEGYADAYLGEQSAWQADSLTVSPYLGSDSLEPFVKVANERQAGIFVLVKTSNPGGGLLQDLETGDDGLPLYRRVAAYVEHLSAKSLGVQEPEGPGTKYGAIGAVVGATYPDQLAELREHLPSCWLLVPGYGSQGGTSADIAAAFHANGLGAVVNNSRGINFAYQRPEYAHFSSNDWQRAIEAATRAMIADLQDNTPAGRL